MWWYLSLPSPSLHHVQSVGIIVYRPGGAAEVLWGRRHISHWVMPPVLPPPPAASSLTLQSSPASLGEILKSLPCHIAMLKLLNTPLQIISISWSLELMKWSYIFIIYPSFFEKLKLLALSRSLSVYMWSYCLIIKDIWHLTSDLDSSLTISEDEQQKQFT